MVWKLLTGEGKRERKREGGEETGRDRRGVCRREGVNKRESEEGKRRLLEKQSSLYLPLALL